MKQLRLVQEAILEMLIASPGYFYRIRGPWKDFLSTLRLVGYDYVLSIEHEDSLMSSQEGLEKAVSFLKEAMLREKPGGMWWA